MTMPFKYINQLVSGKWTPLEEKWLKKVKQIFRQAETNFIRSIRLVWCLGDIDVDSVFRQTTSKENLYQLISNIGIFEVTD
jgi:hypothetical protein